MIIIFFYLNSKPFLSVERYCLLSKLAFTIQGDENIEIKPNDTETVSSDMTAKEFQDIMKDVPKTPKDVEIFVRLYGNLVVRINSILKEKGYTQKSFAEKSYLPTIPFSMRLFHMGYAA